MNGYKKYNEKSGCILISIYLSVVLIMPLIFIFHLFLLNSLNGELFDVTAPMTFFSDEQVLAVTMLRKNVNINLKLDIFYFVSLVFFYPLSEAINKLKTYRNKKPWARVIYTTIFMIAVAGSVLTVYTNMQYFGNTIAIRYPTSFRVVCAIACAIPGLCFCVLMWSKFFDDIVLLCKAVTSKVREIVAVRKK